MLYYPAVPSKFACSTSKISNEHMFCVPGPLMERQGAVSNFHAKRVILMMSVYSLVLAREGPVIRLQRIYNFCLFHAVILSFLDVLQSFDSNFISFFGTNLLTSCPVLVAVFCLFFT